MRKSIEKIICDIIQQELRLPNNYGKTSTGDIIPTVIIYSQNIKLFNTNKLQVTVRTVSQKIWSNRNEFKNNPNSTAPDGSDAFLEIQDINESRIMQIDVYSRNNEARDRFWEIQMALNSVYAQQQMDLYNFKISSLSNVQNISGIDGGSDINRFSITFTVLTHQQKIKTIDYYDKFAATFHNERGQFASIDYPEE